MSEPILPLRQWPSGIQQASVPANDNALRLEALSRPCLGVANDASGSDADGDVWIVGDTPAGAFASFTENDIALYQNASWYAWAPVDGLRLVVNDVRKVYVGESTDEWQDDPSVGGGGGGSDNITLVTEASTSTMDPATHSGRSKLILAADDVTFDSSESYTAGDVFNICATSALDLLVSGVTLTPPSGGTTGLSADMTVSVVMTSSTAGRIIGQTVAA